MRAALLPDSIASRLGWLLTIGLLATVAATYVVSGWDDASRVLDRIAMTAAIVDRAPAASRVALAAALSDEGLGVTWSPDTSPPGLKQDFATSHLARDIRAALGGTGLDRVETGRAVAAATEISSPPARMQAWIALSDGTWLELRVAGDAIEALGSLRVAITIAVLGAGTVLLAVWAARWLTSPLRRLSAAAERLGTDFVAPSLAEDGPREIAQAAKAFNRMQARISGLVEDRTLMLAALSHDLRTVLSRLRLRTEFIRSREQKERALGDLKEMEAMLDATLSFARDDVSAEAATPLDLAVLLQSLCDDLSDAGKHVTYEGPAHLIILGRPTAIRRVFANLIDNALAYGREATVTLAVRGPMIRATVGDRGPGIPQDLRERVFAPFFRVEPSRSRETGGTGLGLTVARTLIRRHGGDVTLDDRPGGGLLVCVDLPHTTAARAALP